MPKDNDQFIDNFAQKLTTFRHQEQLSQQELADLMGVSRNWVSSIETGSREAGRRFRERFEVLVRLRQFGRPDEPSVVKEAIMPYGPKAERQETSSKDCHDYLEAYIQRSKHELGALGYILYTLQRTFPLSDFSKPPNHENQSNTLRDRGSPGRR